MSKIHKLSGKEKKTFRNALISAFPSEDSLNEMVEIVFDKPLNQIASSGNLQHQAFGLIGWTIAQGKLDSPYKTVFVKAIRQSV